MLAATGPHSKLLPPKPKANEKSPAIVVLAVMINLLVVLMMVVLLSILLLSQLLLLHPMFYSLRMIIPSLLYIFHHVNISY